jgi:hypothetical protein
MIDVNKIKGLAAHLHPSSIHTSTPHHFTFPSLIMSHFHPSSLHISTPHHFTLTAHLCRHGSQDAQHVRYHSEQQIGLRRCRRCSCTVTVASPLPLLLAGSEVQCAALIQRPDQVLLQPHSTCDLIIRKHQKQKQLTVCIKALLLLQTPLDLVKKEETGF